MGRARQALTIATLGGALGACSLVYSTSGLTSHDAPAATDAAVDVKGAPIVDSLDAAGDALEPPSRGCASVQPAPKLCRDFDDGVLNGAGIDFIRQESGSVKLAAGGWSSPNAARILFNTAADCAYTRLESELDATGASRVDVRFRLKIEAPWADATPLAVILREPTSSDYCQILLYVGADGTTATNIQRNSTMNDIRSLNGGPRVNEWTSVSLGVTPADMGAKLHFTFGHDGGPNEETSHVTSECHVGGKLETYFGFHCNTNANAANYDDLVVDWQ